MDDGNTQLSGRIFPRVERFEIFESPDPEYALCCAIVALDDDIYKVAARYLGTGGNFQTMDSVDSEEEALRCWNQIRSRWEEKVAATF